jgi:hypothetical protein
MCPKPGNLYDRMARFASLGLEYAIPYLNLGVLHLFYFQPGNAPFKLIALMIQESRKLDVGYFRLVDPETVQGDGVWVPIVITREAAHLEGAAWDVDHRHAVRGSYQGITQLRRIFWEADPWRWWRG